MSTLLRFVTLALVSSCSLAQAQLVSLTLQGTVLERFGGSDWWTASGDGIGAPARLDVMFDANLTPTAESASGPFYEYVAPPNQGVWRLRFGQLDLTGNFERMARFDTKVWASAFLPDTYATLGIELTFAEALPARPARPDHLPPLAPPSPAAGLSGYLSTFRFDTLATDGLAEGGIVVGVDALVAGVVSPPLPIPEPATYGGAALLVLGILMGWRRWRRAAG